MRKDTARQALLIGFYPRMHMSLMREAPCSGSYPMLKCDEKGDCAADGI